MSNFYHITSEGEAKRAVKWLMNKKILALDTETTGLDHFTCHPILVQIGDEEKQFVFDITKIPAELLREVIESPDILKVVQNGTFDYKMLAYHHNIHITRMFDTRLAELLLNNGLPKRESSLKFLAEKYLGMDMSKELQTSFVDFMGAFSSEQIEYAALDVKILLPIMKQQAAELKAKKMQEVAKLEFALIEPVASMEMNGIKLDAERWNVYLKEVKKQVMRTKGALLEILPTLEPPQPPPLKLTKDGSPFARPASFKIPFVNLDSPVQLSDILQNKMKINLVKYDAITRAGITNTNTLKRAVLDLKLTPTQKQTLDLLLQYRKIRQITKNFGDNLIAMINPITGRIHGRFHQLRPASGRFSSSDPNMQNIPKRHEESAQLRTSFVAEPGWKIISGDYSQIEIRILAELSDDPTLINALTTGGDIHKSTASLMFNVDMDNLYKTDEAKFKKHRNAAKAINFGIIYGMSAQKLAQQLGVSLQDAEGLFTMYRSIYTNALKWMDKLGVEVSKRMVSTTILGRVRQFSMADVRPEDKNKIGSHIQRAGKNHVIQGSSADMTKTAIVFIHKAIQSYGAKLINTVHDEIVVEAPEDVADKVKDIMEDCMMKAGQVFLKKVPVLVEMKVDTRWS